MATIVTSNPAMPLVSIEEYLRTTYHPDCEYIDGRIEERNLGQYDHGLLQTLLAALFTNHRRDWGVFAVTEVRVQVAATHFRIPDVTILRVGSRKEPIISYPPLIAIEILSPGDRRGQIDEKLDDYFTFGVENIWIFDTERRSARVATPSGMTIVSGDVLTAPNSSIRVVLSDLFAGLD